MCLSLVVASGFATTSECLINGGFESVFNYDGTDWCGVGLFVEEYEWYRSTTYHYAGAYSFYTGYDTSYEYGYPLNIWQGLHLGDGGVNPHDVATISIYVLGSTGQFLNSNVIQVLTSGGWVQVADLSNNTDGFTEWTQVVIAGGHGGALDTATGGLNITSVSLILYTGSTTHPEMGIAVDSFSVTIEETAAVTPEGTPAGVTPDADATIGAFANMVAPLVVMCIPAFILGVWLRGGLWGLLIGIDIGVALAYGFLPTAMKPAIWLIFLVGLGNFGMIWKGRG